MPGARLRAKSTRLRPGLPLQCASAHDFAAGLGGTGGHGVLEQYWYWDYGRSRRVLAARGYPRPPRQVLQELRPAGRGRGVLQPLVRLAQRAGTAAPSGRAAHALAHAFARPLMLARHPKPRGGGAHSVRRASGRATLGALRRPPHAERSFAERCPALLRASTGLHGGFQEKDDAKALLREIRSVQQHQRVVGMAE